VKPLNDYVIVRVRDKNKETADKIEKKTGIFIPESANLEYETAMEQGEVIFTASSEVSVGDQVLFNTFATLDFRFQGKETWAINIKDIIAIL